MKVLQLGKFYPIRGGVEKVMFDLTRGLSERGVQCDMLCAMLLEDTVDDKDRKYIEETEGPEVVLRFNEYGRVICLPAKKKVAATMMCPAMVKWMRKHAREYDIVHVHHPDPMACLALRLSGYKGRVVVHWHSDILKQKTIMRFYKFLQSWMLRRADVIVGTTPKYLAESPWLKKHNKKFAVVPIGVDKVNVDEVQKDRALAAAAGKKIIFSLGRLVEYKGYKYLVEAAQYLPDDYLVAIGGIGPLRTELEEQALELGVYNKVKFLGWLEDDETAGWFGACDVFALPSVMKTEAFAIVQIEAMSCGKPVVSTDIPGSGVSWVNKDGESGIVVPPCDAKAFADALVRITSDKGVYRKYSEGAAARFEQMFTFDKMIDNCQAVYEHR